MTRVPILLQSMEKGIDLIRHSLPNVKVLPPAAGGERLTPG
jgi:hypothetical protein